MSKSGPLAGLKVVEFAGLGPAPFCAMLLADLGADVVRIDRPGADHTLTNIMLRGRPIVSLDLKHAASIEACLDVLDHADALIEGFRPGVMERLGLGPDIVCARNPKLIYGRMTGWGQDGPYAQRAGHDINYIAISGALAAIGPKERPAAPLNLVGDFGGGGLFLAFGMLAGILDARATGHGQIVDCAMSEGALSLMSMFYGLSQLGLWTSERSANLLDGGAPFYDVYQCADGAWISVGAVEPVFYAQLCKRLDLERGFDQDDRAQWPDMRAAFADRFRSRTRPQWLEIFGDADVCVAPVLDLGEAPRDQHYVARQSFIEIDGVVQPAPMPRFSRTPGAVGGPYDCASVVTVLEAWGMTPAAIAAHFRR